MFRHVSLDDCLTVVERGSRGMVRGSGSPSLVTTDWYGELDQLQKSVRWMIGDVSRSSGTRSVGVVKIVQCTLLILAAYFVGADN